MGVWRFVDEDTGDNAEKCDGAGDGCSRRFEGVVPMLVTEGWAECGTKERRREMVGCRNGVASLEGVPSRKGGEDMRGGVKGFMEDVEGVLSEVTSRC